MCLLEGAKEDDTQTEGYISEISGRFGGKKSINIWEYRGPRWRYSYKYSSGWQVNMTIHGTHEWGPLIQTMSNLGEKINFV